MITGSLSSTLDELIDVVVAKLPAAHQQQIVTAVVDTGYSDYLMLPFQTVLDLDLELRGSTIMYLADGSQTVLDIYNAYIIWHEGVWRQVEVLASDGGPLVGMSLLSGSRLSIDVVAGGAVTIDPLP